MKGYCKQCSEIIDETEHVQNGGYCAQCLVTRKEPRNGQKSGHKKGTDNAIVKQVQK